MGFVDFEIKHDSTNISDHVINYSRNQQICTGVGTLDVTLENENLNRSIIPWDKIVLYEEGHKIGTYIVASVIDSAEGGTRALQCQDYSKRLIDNYITTNYNIAYQTTTRYWIEFFLSETGLDYEFTTTSDGEIVAPNANFGMSSAYDLIVSFLQQSGWYIYFDANGKAIVGSIEAAGDQYDDTLNDTEVLTITRSRNDNRLRNRAVVWGMGDPLTGSWIGADISQKTPWQIDGNDQRAIVLSNSMIYSTAVAEDLARKMLKEFARIANEIIVETVGHHDIELGDMVHVHSKHFSGKMKVTTIESEGSANGLILRLTLNQMCPRLFAYFGYLSEFIPIYIGTWGQGVWKKYTGGTIWSQASSGLAEQGLFIKDLFVKMGNLACVTDDGYMYYSNIVNNIWTKFEHGDLIDLDVNLYMEADCKAVACSIDDLGNIIVGYNYINEDRTIKRSWILTISGTGVLLKAEQVIPQQGVNYTEQVQLIDLEAVGYPEEGIIESVYQAPSGAVSLYGSRSFQPYYGIDVNCYSIGPAGSFTWSAETGSSIWTAASKAGFILDSDDTCWFLEGWASLLPTKIVKLDLTTMTRAAEYNITGFDYVPGEEASRWVIQKYGVNSFNIIQVRKPTIDEFTLDGIHGLIFKHWRYTIGSIYVTKIYDTIMTPLQTGDEEFPESSGYIDGLYLKNNVVTLLYSDQQAYGGRSSDEDRFYVYELLSSSGVNFLCNDLLVDYEGYASSTIKEFIFSSGNTIFTGFIRSRRKHPLVKGEGEAKKIVLTIAFYAIGSYGAVQPFTESDLRTFTTTYDTIDMKYSAFGGSFYYCIGGASDDYSTNILSEFVLQEWTMPRPGIFEPWIREKQVSAVMSIQLPACTTYVNTIDYGGGEGATYSDESYLHTWENDLIAEPTPYISPVSARVYDPVFVRYGVGGGMELSSGTRINVFIYPTLSQNWVSIANYGVETCSIKVYTTRDDYDGSIYIYVDNSAQGGSVRSLFGLRDNGGINKTISNYNISLSGESAHIIVKNYDFTVGWIRKFSPRAIETTQVLKHTSAPFEAGLIGASVDAEQQTYGIFETILEPPERVKVEISKGVPTVVYTPPWLSGSLGLLPTNYLAASVTNFVNDFYYPPANNYPPYDIRVFDVPSSGFTVASGVLPTDMLLERYIGIAASGEVMMINYGFTGDWLQLVSLSGLLVLASGMPFNPSGTINLLEATNYTLVPYIFVGVSGPPPLFFQRTLYPWWVNASYTLPSSDITIIRVDDDI